MLAKMPLLGASVLSQAEPWDSTEKKLTVAMAVVWSPKLQENALQLVVTASALDNNVGKYSAREWANRQKLESTVGSRSLTDNNGHRIFVGISCADIAGPIIEQKSKKRLADIRAIKAVAFALTGDTEAYTEAKSGLKEHSDDKRVNMESLQRQSLPSATSISRDACSLPVRRRYTPSAAGKYMFPPTTSIPLSPKTRASL